MNTFADLVDMLIGMINDVIPLLFAVTLLIIVWRVSDAWIINGGDEHKIEEGKNTIIVGVIVLVVMAGIWGILSVIRSSLFL